MDQMFATYAIALVAIAYAIVYQAIVAKFGNPKRIKEIQKMQTDAQKDLEQALKSKNDAQIDAANKKMEAAMSGMSEMFILQFKPLFAVIPLLILVTNPQLNFNQAPMFAWPHTPDQLAALPADNITAQMGLAGTGSSLRMMGNDTIVISRGGTDLANISRLENNPHAYVYIGDSPRVIVDYKNDTGVDEVYYPATRIYNPVALQNNFRGYVITLPFSLPIFIQNFDRFPNWRDTFGAFGWFYLCVFFGGLAISLIKSKLDNKSTSSTSATAPPAKTN